jgi:protein-S-isoprenylcysteine O-methyltransferase Ste14
MNEKLTSKRELTPEVRQGINLWIFQASVGLAGYAIILFLSVLRLDWVWGWVILGTITAYLAAHAIILALTNPDLLAERSKGLRDPRVKPWDRVVASLGGGLPIFAWLVAGLDEQFQWTGPVPLAVHLGGWLVMILGYALFLWALASNPFFSEGVRIQSERGHTVATGGPYRYVRHPGYVGAILTFVATPFLLGSLYASIFALAAAALYVLRAFLEDRTLIAELPGYQEYTQQVRYRLLPGVW